MVSVVVATSAAGLTFRVDGTSYSATQAFTWVRGSLHTVETSTPQQFGNIRYDWTGWSDGGAISHSVMPIASTNYTANFSQIGFQIVAIVSGRVLTPDGRGLRNALVSIIDSQGVTRTATTSSFGLYSFDNVVTGAMYTIRVTTKRYRFTPRVMQINGNVSELDFVGLE